MKVEGSPSSHTSKKGKKVDGLVEKVPERRIVEIPPESAHISAQITILNEEDLEDRESEPSRDRRDWRHRLDSRDMLKIKSLNFDKNAYGQGRRQRSGRDARRRRSQPPLLRKFRELSL